MDQIDFTGPFEVLSRMSDTTVQIIGKEVESVRDVQGLRISPDVRIAEGGIFDVLLVPGGYGQQALMHDEDVLGLIRKHLLRDKLLFSVCTGVLLCGAAGVLAGRQVTTHCSARHLMQALDDRIEDTIGLERSFGHRPPMAPREGPHEEENSSVRAAIPLRLSPRRCGEAHPRLPEAV